MLDELASRPDPYPTYAALRARGAHVHDDGRWVVARAVDVEAVLASPASLVGFVPADDDPGAAVKSRMARFSDGADHDRRRSLAIARLADLAPSQLQAAAYAATAERLAAARGPTVEVMGLVAREVPIAVLAAALGADPQLAPTATRALALAMAPPVGSPAGDIAAAAAELVRLVGGPTADVHDEASVNTAALLLQAVDATAGLIGNSILARSRYRPAVRDDLVAGTNRFDPPVQLTTRVAAGPVELADVTIPAGATVVVLLAAANHDPECREPFGFGAEPRRCPGSSAATTLAAGVVDAVVERCAPELVDPEIVYEPRANLRIPVRVRLHLA